MKKIEVFKKVTESIVSMSTGAVITNAVKATTPVSTNPFMKVGVVIGSMVVSSMVSNAAAKHVNDGIDKIVTDFEAAKEESTKTEEN